MTAPLPIDIDALLSRYHGLLLDAYGVLVDKQGPLPGAVALIQRLEAESRPYLILTNSASRLPEAMAADLSAFGLAVPPGRILSSGALLDSHFRARPVETGAALVLGPADAHTYVRRAGVEPLAPGSGRDAGAIVIADQKGFDTLAGMNDALSLAMARLDARRPLELVLCNPDLIYPVDQARYGFTAGALAAMLEAVFTERYGRRAPRFTRLGKPCRPIFDAARHRVGSDNLCMVGDQLATDIAGAEGAGIDSALVRTGLAPRGPITTAVRPR